MNLCTNGNCGAKDFWTKLLNRILKFVMFYFKSKKLLLNAVNALFGLTINK